VILWLTIYSTPPVHLYGHPDALAELPNDERRERLLADVQPLQSQLEDENPTLVVDLENGAGQAAVLFADPPIGYRAELRSADGLLFSGVVNQITLGRSAQLRVEA